MPYHLTRNRLLLSAALLWLSVLGFVACTQNEDVTPEGITMAEVERLSKAYDPLDYASGCPQPIAGATVSFSRDIVPILVEYCVDCHSHDKQYGGVTLTSHSGVEPYAKTLRLVGVIAHTPLYPRMPYNRPKLDNNCIATIATWVLQGAQNN